MMNNLITIHCRPARERTWAHVEPGDIVSYADGTSYYVEDCEIREPSGETTLLVSCIVGPDNPTIEWTFGDKGILSINTQHPLPSGAMITKG